jgi:hypothetical protein
MAAAKAQNWVLELQGKISEAIAVIAKTMHAEYPADPTLLDFITMTVGLLGEAYKLR